MAASIEVEPPEPAIHSESLTATNTASKDAGGTAAHASRYRLGNDYLRHTSVRILHFG